MSSSSSPNLVILDSFKDHSPVLFDGANRIPAVEDVRNILIYVCFATLFLAFLIIFPGIRKEVSTSEPKANTVCVCDSPTDSLMFLLV